MSMRVLCKPCDKDVPRSESNACLECSCYLCKECSKTHECFLKSGDHEVTCCRCSKVFDATQYSLTTCANCKDYICEPCSTKTDDCTKLVDMVNSPPHYNSHPSGVETIEITEWFSFSLGNAIKYIWRAGEKNDAIEDLKKASWYINREITRLSRLADKEKA